MVGRAGEAGARKGRRLEIRCVGGVGALPCSESGRENASGYSRGGVDFLPWKSVRSGGMRPLAKGRAFPICGGGYGCLPRSEGGCEKIDEIFRTKRAFYQWKKVRFQVNVPTGEERGFLPFLLQIYLFEFEP